MIPVRKTDRKRFRMTDRPGLFSRVSEMRPSPDFPRSCGIFEAKKWTFKKRPLTLSVLMAPLTDETNTLSKKGAVLPHRPYNYLPKSGITLNKTHPATSFNTSLLSFLNFPARRLHENSFLLVFSDFYRVLVCFGHLIGLYYLILSNICPTKYQNLIFPFMATRSCLCIGLIPDTPAGSYKPLLVPSVNKRKNVMEGIRKSQKG